MADYNTEPQWGHHNDKGEHQHINEHGNDYDDHMDGYADVTRPPDEDQLAATIAASSQGNPEPYQTEYMEDPGDGEYTLGSHDPRNTGWNSGGFGSDSYAGPAQHWSTEQAYGLGGDHAVRQTQRKNRQADRRSSQRAQGSRHGGSSSRQSLGLGSYYNESGDRPYFPAAAEDLQSWDYAAGQDGLDTLESKGYEEGMDTIDIDALAEKRYIGHHDNSEPAYGQGPGLFEFDPPSTHYSHSSSRPNRTNRVRDMRVHYSHDFVPGKVFIIDWPEPKGHSIGTTIYSGAGENIYRKDRRFVVMMTRRGRSDCIAIATYRGRGCTKPGVHSDDHGIIYTGDESPGLLPGEEKMGFDPVRMVPDNATEQLDSASRINYSKIYPVEHNFPVKFIGEVQGEHLLHMREAIEQCRKEAYETEFQYIQYM